MSFRLTRALFLMPAFLLIGPALPAAAEDDSAGKKPPTLNELSMEVSALQTIYIFDFTPNQLKMLRKLAKDTAGDTGARQKSRASSDFHKILSKLRDALATAKNEELIDELQEKLEGLRDKENPDLDDGLEITDEARTHAPEVLKLLTARQVAAHVASFGTQMPDPVETLLTALDGVRELDDKKWKEFRDEIPEEIGRLAAGLNVEKGGEIAEKVVQLFIEVRSLKNDEFKARHQELEKTARQILGNIGPFDVLRHIVEASLAELLSNPRLAAAVDARLKK
ncbi:MAG TPA: hypothetical protein VK395_07795 [Gemmataceae bacterium]|nr:hypothetical protein [Gemmataceae bacterium]